VRSQQAVRVLLSMGCVRAASRAGDDTAQTSMMNGWFSLTPLMWQASMLCVRSFMLPPGRGARGPAQISIRLLVRAPSLPSPFLGLVTVRPNKSTAAREDGRVLGSKWFGYSPRYCFKAVS